MSDMKCPFCGRKLGRKNINDRMCSNEKCVSWKGNFYGSEDLWQALTQAKQDLGKSKERCSAWEKKVLDCQMKALALNAKLEIAKSALRQINLRLVIAPEFVAREALEQIEHEENQ